MLLFVIVDEHCEVKYSIKRNKYFAGQLDICFGTVYCIRMAMIHC